MNETMTLLEITKKLIGGVMPVGESTEDEVRFENLKVLCNLADDLIIIIDEIAYDFKDRQEHSLNKAGKYAAKFMRDSMSILKTEDKE